MAAVENTCDFGSLALRIVDAVDVRGVFENLTDVRIGEAAAHVLARQQGAEDLDFVAGDRIERLGGPFGSNLLLSLRNNPLT